MKLPRIAIILSDVSGSGCEMLLQMLQDPSLFDVFTPVVIGSHQVALDAIQQLGITAIPFHVITAATDIIDGRFNFIDVQPTADETFTTLSIATAFDAVYRRMVDTIVLLPSPLLAAGSAQPFVDIVRNSLELQDETFDWNVAGPIRSLLLQPIDATTELGEGIASEALQAQLSAISRHLRQDLTDLRPRLAVLSSQPKMHADLVDIHEQGILAFGPFDAPSFIAEGKATHYDAVLFYGDSQGLRPQLRCPLPDQPTYGYVSGLPVVVTYPIVLPPSSDAPLAATGDPLLADTSVVALRQAIYASIDLLRTRIRYRVATHDPLQKYWVPRGRDDFKLDLTKED